LIAKSRFHRCVWPIEKGGWHSSDRGSWKQCCLACLASWFSLDTNSRDEVKARLEALIASFPDIHFSVDVEGWSDVDSLQLLQQLGLGPAVFPGPATPTT
jgi:hypothetical protein